MSLTRKIRSLFARREDAALRLFNIVDPFRGKSGDRLLRRREQLRKQLRRTPYWAAGHLRLGFAELALAEAADCSVGAQHLAGAEVSAQAASELLTPVERERSAVGMSARYLLGRILFQRQDFKAALPIFQSCLQPPASWFITETEWDQLHEYSAAALLALGDDTEAEMTLRQIPEARRSAQAQLMLRRFNQFQGQ